MSRDQHRVPNSDCYPGLRIASNFTKRHCMLLISEIRLAHSSYEALCYQRGNYTTHLVPVQGRGSTCPGLLRCQCVLVAYCTHTTDGRGFHSDRPRPERLQLDRIYSPIILTSTRLGRRPWKRSYGISFRIALFRYFELEPDGDDGQDRHRSGHHKGCLGIDLFPHQCTQIGRR